MSETDAGAPPQRSQDVNTSKPASSATAAAGTGTSAAHSGEAGAAGKAGSAAAVSMSAHPDAGVEATHEASPSMPSAGAGGAGSADEATTSAMDSSDMLVRPDASECEYVEVRARGDGDGSPFQVPSGDVVQCFLIDLGFEAPTQALEFKPMIDKSAIVQDVVLRTLERSESRGPLVSCADTWPTHQMVAAWTPGYDDWYYPADMGIDLGRGLFLLEVYYSNNSGTTQDDRTGMRICTTKKLRPRTASMSWLGNQLFSIPPGASDYPVSGRCTPQMQTDPIHILRTATFMHDHGKRATMQIDRIDGTTQLLVDEQHRVGFNKIHETPATVRVGDTVLSTCYFDNPSPSSINIGVPRDKELCHFMVLAYPAHSLVGDTLLRIETNSCLGMP